MLPSNVIAYRLNRLATQTIDRIRNYGSKRPNVSRETREGIEYAEFARGYERAKVRGFGGNLVDWIQYCRDVLERVKRVARNQSASWVRRVWNRLMCQLYGHDWYDYQEGRRLCTRCLRVQRLEGEIWQKG